MLEIGEIHFVEFSLGVIIAMVSEELSGKKVRAEYRIGRRTHRVGIGTLRIGSGGVEAVFPFQSRAVERSHVFRLSQQQLKRLVSVHHAACDFQFIGVLDIEEGVSEDDGAWIRPPKIVTTDYATPNA
jgi:hypothetical protein